MCYSLGERAVEEIVDARRTQLEVSKTNCHEQANEKIEALIKDSWRASFACRPAGVQLSKIYVSRSLARLRSTDMHGQGVGGTVHWILILRAAADTESCC